MDFPMHVGFGHRDTSLAFRLRLGTRQCVPRDYSSARVDAFFDLETYLANALERAFLQLTF